MVSRFNDVIHLSKINYTWPKGRGIFFLRFARFTLHPWLESRGFRSLGIKNIRLLIFLISLVLLAIFFRFYNFSHLLYWMFDEERDAFVVKRILVDRHFTLIGGSIPGAFYLAPGYFYISAIFYFLSNGNPLGPAIAASILGVISVVLLFFIAQEFFGKRAATFAALIYCVSYLVVIYNRTWWPLTFAPTVALLTYFSLYKIIKFRDLRWSIPLSFALMIGAQSDPSNFSLILLSLLFWFLFKLPFKNKYVIWAIFLFISSHLPLVIFDLRHNFFNSKLIFKMLTFGQSGGTFQLFEALKGLILFPQTFSRLIYISNNPDMALQIVPFKFYLDLKLNAIPSFLLIPSILILFWFFLIFIKSISKKNNLGVKIIGTHVLIALLGIFLYNLLFPNYTYEWFLQVLFPAFTIILGLLLMKIYSIKHFTPLVFLALVFYLLISILVILNAKNSYNFGHKSEAVKWTITQLDKKPFSLDSPSSSFSYGGYRYLFYLYAHEPVKSYMDPVFVDWMYPKSSIAKDHPDKVVAIMNPDFFYDPIYWNRYQIYLTKTIARKNFGRIEVLIVDNSDKWVDW